MIEQGITLGENDPYKQKNIVSFIPPSRHENFLLIVGEKAPTTLDGYGARLIVEHPFLYRDFIIEESESIVLAGHPGKQIIFSASDQAGKFKGVHL